MRLCQTEHTAQKARREVEEKVQEEAEKQRVTEEKKKLEYIQQLQDEVLEKETALLKGLKNPRLQDLSKRKSLPEMKMYNGLLRRLEGSNQGSTAEVL